ncbi:hypothetical protein MSA_8930 [Streptococcus agalactiae ILRI005]|nr:hypothetical protein MSA_8930 [Streptococcus agalactiae ILRI005]
MCLLKQIITHKVLSTFIVYIQATAYDLNYLKTKKEKMGHLLD